MTFTSLSTTSSEYSDSPGRGETGMSPKKLPMKLLVGGVFVVATMLAVIVSVNTRSTTRNKAAETSLSSTQCQAQQGTVKSSCTNQEKLIGTIESTNDVCCQLEIASSPMADTNQPTTSQQTPTQTTVETPVTTAPTSTQTKPTSSTDSPTPSTSQDPESTPGTSPGAGGSGQDGGGQCVPLVTVIRRV